ncbi:MAG: sugar MFS transporter [Chloroflexi bacterium]|nr:sugar MFS transporter [Chloroflexota bacterium]
MLLALLTAVVRFSHRSVAGTETAVSTPNRKAYLSAMTNPNLLRYTVDIFIYLGVEIGIATWITTYLMARFHIGIAEAAAIVSLYWLVQTVGRLSGGFILNRFQWAVVLAVFALGCGLSLVIALSRSPKRPFSYLPQNLKPSPHIPCTINLHHFTFEFWTIKSLSILKSRICRSCAKSINGRYFTNLNVAQGGLLFCYRRL